MVFSPNDSPLAGREGQHLTGSKIGERLAAEAATSVSLRVIPVADGGGEAFEVQARGGAAAGPAHWCVCARPRFDARCSALRCLVSSLCESIAVTAEACGVRDARMLSPCMQCGAFWRMLQRQITGVDLCISSV